VLRGGERVGVSVGPLEERVLEACGKPVGWRAFLCGDPERVLSLRKKLFLAGISLRDIHADAFLPSNPPPQAGAGAVAGASDSSR
jgi:hypothetical protein